jgi:hypothetical protein
MNTRRKVDPRAQVDSWNRYYPTGTEVEYRLHHAAMPKLTTTTTEAQLLGGHTAVVWVKGVSGCVAISHCTPVAEGRRA